MKAKFALFSGSILLGFAMYAIAFDRASAVSKIIMSELGSGLICFGFLALMASIKDDM